MPKFKIQYTETALYEATIEADTEDAARDIVLSNEMDNEKHIETTDIDIESVDNLNSGELVDAEDFAEASVHHATRIADVDDVLNALNATCNDTEGLATDIDELHELSDDYDEATIKRAAEIVKEYNIRYR